MEEIWRDIPGYEGLYRVSNLGDVLSLNYCGRGYSQKLTPKCNNKGRLWVELVKGGKKTAWLIHRLVGMVFIPNPHGYPQINHKDENPKNNRVENLEWCTAKYNNNYYLDRHREELLTRRGKRMTKQVVQKTLDGDVVRIWDNSRQVLKETGWHDWSISECCRGNRKTAYGFIWHYAN